MSFSLSEYAKIDVGWLRSRPHWGSLQRSALNASARLTYHLRQCDHITDALVCFHWLYVPERVQLKIAVLTYNVLHGQPSHYLSSLTRVADLPGCHRSALSAITIGECLLSSCQLSAAEDLTSACY